MDQGSGSVLQGHTWPLETENRLQICPWCSEVHLESTEQAHQKQRPRSQSSIWSWCQVTQKTRKGGPAVSSNLEAALGSLGLPRYEAPTVSSSFGSWDCSCEWPRSSAAEILWEASWWTVKQLFPLGRKTRASFFMINKHT